MNQIPFTQQEQDYFMKLAINQAKKAYAYNEVPIGAVVVNSAGDILSRAYNKVESRHTQSAHAEMQALIKASKRRKDWRFEDAWVFVTLEPCAMCYHFLCLSRVSGVVIGAASPLFGYRLDNEGTYRVYKNNPLIIGNEYGEREAKILLKMFFKNKRNSRGG